MSFYVFGKRKTVIPGTNQAKKQLLDRTQGWVVIYRSPDVASIPLNVFTGYKHSVIVLPFSRSSW